MVILGCNNSITTNLNNSVILGNLSTNLLGAGVTSITGISDERDKTIIETLPDCISIIEQINPIMYQWNPRDNNCTKKEKEIGFSAQNLLSTKYGEYLVDTTDTENLKIKRELLIPIMVGAIKELISEYETLNSII
jgi:hypothetical protein